jgi:N-acetylglutamate synthase-like GNAT family acetyltransferase
MPARRAPAEPRRPRVRKMRTGDMRAVLSLLAEANMVPVAPSPAVPEPEVSELIVEHTFVAELDHEIVGVASYFVRSATVGETGSFAVRERLRGSGIGALLQRARLQEMQARGMTKVITQTDRPSNVDWFVRRFGYREVGHARKRHDFGDSTIDHWVVLELDLASWRPGA